MERGADAVEHDQATFAQGLASVKAAARVDRFARAMPAGRIPVNSPAAQGCCGMTTGLDRSLTLGCGTFGGTSTTDNITYRHLLNIKRVAYGRKG